MNYTFLRKVEIDFIMTYMRPVSRDFGQLSISIFQKDIIKK